jgi:hypothetical protein
MESQELSTPTINDLRKIARDVGVENLKGNEGVKDILHHIKDQIYTEKIPASYKITTLDALELGSCLLETVITLEQIAKEKDYVLWWRYTDGIEENIGKKHKPISFSRTLLAGFIHDGIGWFKTEFGFNSACAFCYWANAYYFKHYSSNKLHRTMRAVSGSLVMLPLTTSEETELLKDLSHCLVFSLDQSVFGKGEHFHPRLSSKQLEQMKGRLITVCSNGQFIDSEKLSKQLTEAISGCTYDRPSISLHHSISNDMVIEEDIEFLKFLSSELQIDPEQLGTYVLSNSLNNNVAAAHLAGVHYYAENAYEEAKSWFNYGADMNYERSQIFLDEIAKKIKYKRYS